MRIPLARILSRHDLHPETALNPRFTAVLALRAQADGTLAVTISPADTDERLAVEDTVLVLTAWAEGPETVRGRVEHPQSGTVAYFQSTTAIGRLAEAIGLACTPFERPR